MLNYGNISEALWKIHHWSTLVNFSVNKHYHSPNKATQITSLTHYACVKMSANHLYQSSSGWDAASCQQIFLTGRLYATIGQLKYQPVATPLWTLIATLSGLEFP